MTKNDLLQIIKMLAIQYKRFPKIPEISEKTGIPVYKVQLALKQLVDNGHLTQRGNWYRFPDSAEDLREFNRVHATVSDITEKTQNAAISTPQAIFTTTVKKTSTTDNTVAIREKETQSLNSLLIYVLRGFMGLIGIGAIVLSAYYTSLWAIDFLPIFWAGLLSGLVVSFSTLAFEASIVLRKLRQRSAAVLFIILWLIGLLYSITTTVAGQYNAYIKNEQNTNKATVSMAGDLQQLNLWKQKEKDASENIDKLNIKLKPLYLIMTDIGQTADRKNDYPVTWKETNDKIDKLEIDLYNNQKERTEAQNTISNLLKQKPGIAESENKESILDFYGWIASIFKMSKNMAQFVMGIFPAVFIDFLAPAALAFALFSTGTNNKKSRFSYFLNRFIKKP
jgi:hypothetical protein